MKNRKKFCLLKKGIFDREERNVFLCVRVSCLPATKHKVVILLNTQFQIIEQHVGNLLRKLPSFSEECSKVIQKAQEISSR